MAAYRQQLEQFVFRSTMVMRPIFEQAQALQMRVTFAEGEDERVLRAVQTIVDDGVCRPILVGRPSVIQMRIERLGLRLVPDQDFDLIDPNNDNRFSTYWQAYHLLMERKGVTPDIAKTHVRTNSTIIAALTVYLGDSDAMIAGTFGRYQKHLSNVLDVIPLRPEHGIAASLNLLVMDQGICFMCDPYVNHNPDADAIAEMTLLAAEQVARFGITPKIALLSHSNFGSSDDAEALKMRKALELIKDQAPELEVEGEMHADAALSEEIRNRIFPNSTLHGRANLLIMPSIDAANIAFNMVRMFSNGLSVGPILMGTTKPAHIVTPSITVRGLVNMAALAAVDAQILKQQGIYE
jgi:malate dehydrogenase (oxaloacetate-decarboxylating)(NADP+)